MGVLQQPSSVNAQSDGRIPHRLDIDEPAGPGAATELLIAWSGGDERARERMLPLVYDELRRLAAGYLRRERPGHTLQPTALVHEAYVRLIDQRQVDWTNRAQFIGLAAVMMRRILVNHARDRLAEKRGGGAEHVPLTIVGEGGSTPDINLLDLHEALERLSELDARKSQIVELKFFGGLSMDEIAETVQVSRATVERDWKFARAWLYRAVSGTPS
jgi:RNA polymerase sigma factor (TIGR02999 family)